VRPRGRASDGGLADNVASALAGASDLVAYPAITLPGRQGRRIVVKGDVDLPAKLRAALGDLLAVRRRHPGIMDVEVDPVEWQS